MFWRRRAEDRKKQAAKAKARLEALALAEAATTEPPVDTDAGNPGGEVPAGGIPENVQTNAEDEIQESPPEDVVINQAAAPEEIQEEFPVDVPKDSHPVEAFEVAKKNRKKKVN